MNNDYSIILCMFFFLIFSKLFFFRLEVTRACSPIVDAHADSQSSASKCDLHSTLSRENTVRRLYGRMRSRRPISIYFVCHANMGVDQG
ncbi:uncharacterized protein BO88DRAFT_233943 [Aspergillus vadensis CBS 113365]|uniref:Uncharacterized protein n=1 Tax=Aspergillus vadensis (strain CBS 113365 / IMI 142717 / IBT 24658) TaxID=1448311 RepID=A0A319C052_ASPVC|nr:hypothetical protein BO88DRAFT_233943 [Aspergillus vadensis CBS 113365]PYH71553.1 hypothetical protein BO88DRAFT_233943 [Aspergillus vadensis CBS 113365]